MKKITVKDVLADLRDSLQHGQEHFRTRDVAKHFRLPIDNAIALVAVLSRRSLIERWTREPEGGSQWFWRHFRKARKSKRIRRTR